MLVIFFSLLECMAAKETLRKYYVVGGIFTFYNLPYEDFQYFFAAMYKHYIFRK